MPTLQEILDAARRGDRRAAAYLADPSTAPGANAPQQEPVIQGRGRPLNGYADVAPLPPTGMVSPFGAVDPNRPGAFANFADYANQTQSLRTTPRPTYETSPARNTIPDAPQQYSPAESDNAAWAEARRAAQAGIAQEGYPYMQSPQWVERRIELDRAIEADRLAQAERQRREDVSWQDWWHWGGRQAGFNDPGDPAYRFTQAPELPQRTRSALRAERRGRK